MNLTYLWGRAQLAMNKKTNISHYQTIDLLKIWFLFLVSTKGQTRDKGEFVTKFVEIVESLSYENLSEIPCKIFAVQCFSADHLKHKTIKKTIFRNPSVSPCQLCAHFLKSFWTALIIFWSCWFIWQSIFDHFQISLIWFINFFFLQEQCK